MFDILLPLLAMIFGLALGVLISKFSLGIRSNILTEISTHLLSVSKDVKTIIEQQKQQSNLPSTLDSIQKSISRLNKDMNSLSNKILKDIRREQEALIKSVQNDFGNHIDESRQQLAIAIQRELSTSGYLNDHKEREKVVNSLVELIRFSLHSMGEFQRAAIETQSDAALKKIETTVIGAVAEVSSDLRIVQNALLPLVSNQQQQKPPS